MPLKTPESVPDRYLPQMFAWPLWTGDPGGSSGYPGFLPRSPSRVVRLNVSANIMGMLARPTVSGDLVFLADSNGVYALRRASWDLAWGVEVYFDNLLHRSDKYPQPLDRWVALGLRRFVKSYGVGRHVYVATSSAPEGNALVLALDRYSGAVVWRAELSPEPGTTSRTSASSNLVVADGRIFVGTLGDGGHLFCLTEDGKVVWRRALGGSVVGIAYGDGILFAVSGAVYAMDGATGDVLWTYRCSDCNAPVYRDGYLFIVEYGELIALSASKGSVVWKKSLGVGVDASGTWRDPHMSVGSGAIISSRSLGDRPRGAYATDLYGSVLWEFRALPEEDPSKPIASGDVTVLPVRSGGSAKVYLLWRNGEKLGEVLLPQREQGWMPVASAAYGEIYVTVDPTTLYVLKDDLGPEVSKVSVALREGVSRIRVEVIARDRQSSLLGVVLVYSINCSKWSYEEMGLARAYVMEPIGGYGYTDEVYASEVGVVAGTTIELYLVVVDRVGNYVVTGVSAYRVVAG